MRRIVLIITALASAACFDSDEVSPDETTGLRTISGSPLDLDLAGEPGHLWGPCSFTPELPHGCHGGGGWGLVCSSSPEGWLCVPQTADPDTPDCSELQVYPLAEDIHVADVWGHCQPVCRYAAQTCGEGLACDAGLGWCVAPY